MQNFNFNNPNLENIDSLLLYENARARILLGNLTENPDASTVAIARRAKNVHVSTELLGQWYVNYHLHGPSRVITALPVIPKSEFQLIRERLDCLQVDEWIGELLTPEMKKFNIKQVSNDLVKRFGKSARSWRRYIERWLAGGALALSKSWNPVGGKKNNLLQRQSRATLETIDFQNKLCELVLGQPGGITNAVEWYSSKAGVGKRTLWMWIRAYRNPPDESSRPLPYNIRINCEPIVVELTRGFLLGHPHIHVTKATKILETIFAHRGLKPPTVWQVRRIKNETITEADYAYIHNRRKGFDSNYQVTGPMSHDGVIMLLDFSPLDRMVFDNRLTTKTTQTRPNFVNAMFAVSVLWPCSIAFFDRMNQIDVAELLVELFEKYGKPDQLWVDGGGELTAKTIKRLCEALGIRLYIVKRPQQNGVVEARNKYVNDMYSRTSAGDYTGANLNERPAEIHARLDIETVQRELDELREEYNHTVSADDGMSPLERFERFDITVPMTDEERLLARRLMLKLETRQIQKYGINLSGKTYWFVELGTVDIYSKVGVWFDDRYGPPEEIYVELPDGRIVMARDQDKRPPSPSEINDAKRLQREYMNQRTKDSKTYEQVEKSMRDETAPVPLAKVNGMDVGSSVSDEDGTIENASDAGNDALDDDYQNILNDGL